MSRWLNIPIGALTAAALLAAAFLPNTEHTQPGGMPAASPVTTQAISTKVPEGPRTDAVGPTDARPVIAPQPFQRGPQLELFFRDDYPHYWRHRAVALGPYGVIGAAFREPSQTAAIETAQRKCSEKLQWHPIAAARTERCITIAVDEHIGPVLDDEPQGPRLSSNQLTWRTGLPANASRGILLHLADCGPKPWREWHETWADFVAAKGWAVATLGPLGSTGLPDGCAETPWERNRIASLLRDHLASTIKRFRETYPDVQLAVWADGSGGDVIHASKFASGVPIVTTNTGCGFGGGRRSLLEPTAAVTAMVGTRDLRLAALARDAMVNSISELCGEAAKHLPNLSHHAIETRDSFALWRGHAMNVLAKALQLPVLALRPAATSTLKYLPYEAQLTYNRSFRLYSFHRAFVLSPNGRMFFSSRHESAEEAVRAAVYRCQKNLSGNGFERAGAAACTLFAQDDNILIR